MAQEIPETTYVPEVAKDARKERERRTVQDGTALWKRRKEELERRKHREQRELQQILENYSPWGKPGGGAPCAATLRKKNVPLEPIEAIESLVRPESLEQGRCRNFGQLTALWPWGRPGPGGVPWRDPKLLGARFLESLGWTSDATIERIHRKHINPMDVTDTNRFFDDKGTMSGVASGMPPVEEPMRRYNDEVQVYELTGGVELVPLLTSRRYYSQQPQSTRYVATDATRPGYTIEPLRRLGIGNREYIAELVEQMRRKREHALEERRMEQESCRRHFDTWRRLWGRPGHGAPMDHAHRNNLYNILYRPVIY
ncbi:uncharacterized protein LOC117222062 isoform X4 [Megalopta genalis]|uniref:uncharacterized protein LOC117222062 isoform X4 n=1 Tax=Megalopta genalis TaxID=115081 RepID=UPI0014438407|nr:uncharacterized protein LOC117222062 isoform X3 [Megalopta genalis]